LIRLLVNDRVHDLDVPPGGVLLDALRRDLRLVGVREGCREGDCGSCLVLLGEGQPDGGMVYRPVNSCLLPAGDAVGRHVVTIEGLNGPGLSAIQQGIVDEGATQCGFCTPGLVVALTAFLLNAERLDEEEACAAMAGNICRCTGYLSLRRVAAGLCERFGTRTPPPRGSRARLEWLVAEGILPGYFLDLPSPAATERPPRKKAAKAAGIVVGGGTDLFVQRPEELESTELVFLSRAPGLAGITVVDGVCRIGAATPTEDIGESPLLRGFFPELPSFWRLISSQPIRHRATLAGNLVNASPIGDLTIFFLALDATLTLRAGARLRELPLREFFRGYKQLDLAPGETVESLAFAVPTVADRLTFEKVSRRTHLDIASVNSALGLRVEGEIIVRARLSAGGVAPIPMRLARTEAFLAGRRVDTSTVQATMAMAREEIAPISDVRGSAEYKRELLGRLVAAHFLRLFPAETSEVAL
jgi:xanthine dehydrogenase small subunit